MENLTEKVAVITGGASGIGFATAKVLADKGARIVLADIEAAALDQAVAALSSSGAKVEGVLCDVSNLASVQHLAATAFSRMGAVHIVFNNAGVAVGGPIAEMKHSDWEWIIKVDLWGPIHGVEAFLPRMIEQRQGGHLLFTSSFAGLVPNEGLGPYCVAKYGVVALAEVLRREIRPHDIGVSVLCPMRVETNIDSSQRNRAADFGAPRLRHECSRRMPAIAISRDACFRSARSPRKSLMRSSPTGSISSRTRRAANLSAVVSSASIALSRNSDPSDRPRYSKFSPSCGFCTWPPHARAS